MKTASLVTVLVSYRPVFLPLFLVAMVWCLPGSNDSYAQSSLSGRVTDALTGEPLIGVNVIVVGTNAGAATDLEGRYRVPSIRPGEYSVKVSYIGFETKLFTGIRIESGRSTTLDIELEEHVLSTEEEIVVVGERPLVDVEQSSSTVSIGRDQLEAAPVRGVEEVVGLQAGVFKDPTGLYIRGGRASETGYIVDGVSAKDPLSGTGFGLDIGSNSFGEVEVTTGGTGAQHGDVTSGIVSVTTQDGGDRLSGSFSHKRDGFGGLNRNVSSNFLEDLYEFSLGGPIIPRKLRFFTSGQIQWSDGFTRQTATPDQLSSSLLDSEFWMPRTGNRWSGLGKLTYDVRPGARLQVSYQRSLNVNQNTRMLQITGNEAVVRPGFQYPFILQPDNANTYSHDTNIAYVRWSHVISDQSFYEIQVSRLFTRLRADANGRNWRPEQVDTELNPESIVSFPADLFVDPNGNPPNPQAVFVLPGPGFYNNDGIATRWHDHFAEERTVRLSYTRFSENKTYRLNAGLEAKFNDYQWIDIVRPWVGAPIVTAGGDTTSTNRLGQSADIWRVRPARGGLYASNQIRYRGLIANVGLRLEYWAPGGYVNDLIDNPDAPILPSVREAYREETYGLFGTRVKLRLLPKVRVSFPVRDNQVLFFNYGHSTQLPHPTFVYAGLDPFFQDRSFFADLGNPNLNPEVDISYELGLRNQITSNDVLSLTAFWRDKFDFITIENIRIVDPTGRESVRAFRVNGDFARIRGVEVSYLKRIGSWFQGQVIGSFSKATGLSSTNNDALAQFLTSGNIDNTFETPLAWDRPFDLKASATFRHNEEEPLLGIPGVNNIRLYIASTFRSGQRYTPAIFRGFSLNPFTGERDWRPIYDVDTDPANRYSSVGTPWWWVDVTLERAVTVGPAELTVNMEITNLLNRKNGIIVNPVTGEAFPDLDPTETDFTELRDDRSLDVPNNLRDPRYDDPTSFGIPPFNPARFLPQRHIMFGAAVRF